MSYSYDVWQSVSLFCFCSLLSTFLQVFSLIHYDSFPKKNQQDPRAWECKSVVVLGTICPHCWCMCLGLSFSFFTYMTLVFNLCSLGQLPTSKMLKEWHFDDEDMVAELQPSEYRFTFRYSSTSFNFQMILWNKFCPHFTDDTCKSHMMCPTSHRQEVVGAELLQLCLSISCKLLQFRQE